MLDNKVLEEKLKDESFVKELLSNESAEDAQACFEKNGIELSLDEVHAIGDALNKIASGEIKDEDIEKIANGELSEEELSEAAGGIVTTGALVAIAIAGSVAGTGGVAAIVAFKEEIGNGISSAFNATVDWVRGWGW